MVFKIELPVLWFTPEQVEKMEQAKILGKEFEIPSTDEELAKYFRKRQTFYIVESVTKAYDAVTGITSERFSIVYSGGKPFHIARSKDAVEREMDEILEAVNRNQ